MTIRNTSNAALKADIYTRITETILAQLEQGTRPECTATAACYFFNR